MSNSPIPSEPGDTPTKVVFSDLAGNSTAALALYTRIAGEVSAFLGKARQNRLISGQPSSTMIQARGDGGSFRYQYNHGLETVFVKLATPELTYARTLEQERLVLPNPPLLAIDVLIRPRLQTVGDINSYRTETLPGHPDNNGGDPQDQPNFVQFYSNTEPVDQFPESDYWNYYDKKSGTITVNWGPDLAYLGGNSYKFGPGLPDFDPQTEIEAYHPSGTHVTTGPDWTFIFVYSWQSARSDAGFGSTPNIYLYWTCIAAFQRTTQAGGGQQIRKDQNERRRYFNMLDVIGARVEPEGANQPPYEADSLGMTTDKRLVPLMDGAKVIVERSITVAAATPAKPWMGAGFIAKPLKDFVAGQTPDKVVIDIYGAQVNVIQRNNQGNARPTSQFGTDDSSMLWSMDPLDLWYEVQVRELVDVSPYVVQVNLKGQGEIVRSGFPSDNGTTYLPTAREQSWRFAATGGWTDTKPDPADPAGVDGRGSPAMGKLLANSGSYLKVVATLTPAPREMLDHVRWTGGVQAMTKLATIEWKPTAEPHQHGTAEIRLL